MDSKVIEMNNLRVLNDYLNQTLDLLVRGPRLGNGQAAPLGYSPFSGTIPATAPGIGTDVVYGSGLYGFGSAPLFGGVAPFAAPNPFTGLPMTGGSYTPNYGAFGAYPQAWGQAAWNAPQSPWTSWAAQSPWTAGQAGWPAAEAARQAQVNQALAAKQSVLEAMCRVAGIPV